jgi:hypothetical protein
MLNQQIPVSDLQGITYQHNMKNYCNHIRFNKIITTDKLLTKCNILQH